MSNLRVAIIDDEPNAIKLLQSKLERLNMGLEVTFTASSVDEGIRLLNSEQIYLLFLDVEIRGGTGFDILTELDEIDFDIVFTTAYENYSIQAIKVSAIDYLLKPYSDEDLRTAIEKVIERRKTNSSEVLDRLGKLFESQEGTERILIKERGKIIFLRPSEILYFQGDRAYCHIFNKGGKKITCSHNIGYFEEKLIGHNFMRTHRSYFVNLDHVDEYITSDHQAKLTSGDTVMVSSNMQESFLTALSKTK